MCFFLFYMFLWKWKENTGSLLIIGQKHGIAELGVVLTHLAVVLLGAWTRNVMMGTCWMEMAVPGSVRRKKASTVLVSPNGLRHPFEAGVKMAPQSRANLHRITQNMGLQLE